MFATGGEKNHTSEKQTELRISRGTGERERSPQVEKEKKKSGKPAGKKRGAAARLVGRGSYKKNRTANSLHSFIGEEYSR